MAVNKTFIDSSAFIALFNKRDQFHKTAIAVFAELHQSHTLFISDYIIDEVVTFLNIRCGKKAADQAISALTSSEYLELVIIDNRLFESTAKAFLASNIKGISFTDMSTSVIMEKMEIQKIFTYDGHFKKMGYVILDKC